MTSLSSVTPQIITPSDVTVTRANRFTQPADAETQVTDSKAGDSQGSVTGPASGSARASGSITGPSGLGRAGKAGGAGATDSSSEDSESAVIKALKQQIEALQKQLAAQMQQLHAAQNSNADDSAKASTVAALQAGVTATSAALQEAIAKLAEAIQEAGGSTSGNIVDTTA